MGVEEIRLGRELIPVDRYGRFFINYLGPPGSFPTYAAKDVVNGELPPGALKDKIVLVGATAVGVYDMRVTPFPGFSRALKSRPLSSTMSCAGSFSGCPLLPIPELLLILALGLVLGFTLPRVSAIWVFLIGLFLLMAYLAANYALFRYWGINLDLFTPCSRSPW